MTSDRVKNVDDMGPVLLEYKAMADDVKRSPRGKRLMARIYEKYSPLVKSIAENMVKKSKTKNLDDLVQAGYLGLFTAVEKFDISRCDADKGRPFTACARMWIVREIQLVISKLPTVHKSRQQSMPARIVHANNVHRAVTGRDATAEELGVPEGRFQAWSTVPSTMYLDGGTRIKSRYLRHPIRVPLSAVLTDDHAESPEEIAIGHQERKLVRQLTELDETILLLSEEGYTAKEIEALGMGLGAEDVQALVDWFLAHR